LSRFLFTALACIALTSCSDPPRGVPDWALGEWRVDPTASLPLAKQHPRFDTSDERALVLLEDRATKMSMTVTASSLAVALGSREQTFDVTIVSASDDEVVMTSSSEAGPVRFRLERLGNGVRLDSDESDDLAIYAWVPRSTD